MRAIGLGLLCVRVERREDFCFRFSFFLFFLICVIFTTNIILNREKKLEEDDVRVIGSIYCEGVKWQAKLNSCKQLERRQTLNVIRKGYKLIEYRCYIFIKERHANESENSKTERENK